MIQQGAVKKFGGGRRFRLWWIGLSVACFILGVGCAKKAPPPIPGAQKPYKIDKQWYRPLADAQGFRQKGLASWYGKEFHGRKTANGEIYDMYAVSAAHTILPLGTWVRVRNLDNGRTLDLRVNDRGPFVRGRVIDLSYQAAKVLGVVEPGIAPVEILALGKPSQPGTGYAGARTYTPVVYDRGEFTIQVGAFRDRGNAERLVAKLDQIHRNAHIVPHHSGRGVFYRVRVGRCASLSEALAFEDSLIRSGYSETTVVAE